MKCIKAYRYLLGRNFCSVLELTLASFKLNLSPLVKESGLPPPQWGPKANDLYMYFH